MNATPQASYPCGNFSDTSCLKPKSQKDREAPPRCTAQSNSPPATVPGQVAPGTTWAPGLTQKREPAGLASCLTESHSYSRLLTRFIEFLHFDIQSTGQKSHRQHRRWPSRCFVLIKQSDSLVRTSSKSAARRCRGAAGGRPPGHPPGGGESTETEVPTLAVAGRSARRPGKTPRVAAKHRGRTPPAGPAPTRAPRTPPRHTPARRHPPHPPEPRRPPPPRGGPPTRTGGGGKTPGEGPKGAWRRTPETERRGAGRPPQPLLGPAPPRTSARPTQPLEPILIPKLRI
ncbi:hypothetical protein G5714_024604 [Onychostoma macrolepis]|uniref:Uncharacterized protein n=1 Tax=Onychostoma macrolepis TaxID=369639 RepID=A0A7J6BJQ0_9TELE|nr:hypothetical protein G5714_024604 [Onychostoma macrolepis]